jgi:hypothetical protein
MHSLFRGGGLVFISVFLFPLPFCIFLLSSPSPLPAALYLLITIQLVKCGFAAANFPTAVFPSVVGRPTLRSEYKIDSRDIKVQ